MITKKEPFDFEKEVLVNGTEIFYQKKNKNRTYLGLLLKAGGTRYDPPGKEGCSHMLEQLISAKTRTKNFTNELEIDDFQLEHDIETNAHTTLDSIWLEGNSDISEVDNLFFLLGEQLIKAKLKKGLLEEEKRIITSEMPPTQRLEGWVKVENETNRLIFGNHPFNRIIEPTGTLWSVNSLDLEDIKQQRRRFFIASNLTVVAITKLGLPEIKSRVAEYFVLPEGKISYPKSPESFPKPTKNLISYSYSDILKIPKDEKLGDAVEFFSVIPSSKITYGITVIRQVFTEVFYRELRIRRSLNYNTSVGVLMSRDISKLVVYTGSIPSGQGRKLKDLICEVISQFQEKKRIFEFSKKSILRKVDNSYFSPSEILMETIHSIVFNDRPLTIREQREDIENFDFEKAVDWVGRWLNEDRILVRIFTP